jgi:dienelactone hydrolase
MRAGRQYRMVTVAGLLSLATACAAPPPSAVTFPAEAEAFRRPGNLKQTMIFRPAAGAGPFPAIVLLPTCGGMQSHVFDWAERLIREGYVTLLVETNTARGTLSNCVRPPVVRYDEQLADAVAAVVHLRTLSFVQRDRIGVAGFSFGGGVALRMASAAHQGYMGLEPGSLRVVASFYPWCNESGREWDTRGIPTDGLAPDIVTPTMIFIGADDDETPARACSERADRLRAQGRPISYKVYPETTHAFDGPEFGIQGRRMPRGYFYRYNPVATEDAWRELRTLFARELKP